MGLEQLYRVSDKLYANKAALESHLYQQARDLFEFNEVITLYDLTNTYFEGSAKANANAKTQWIIGSIRSGTERM